MIAALPRKNANGEVSIRAIRTGTEALTCELLDGIRLDEASEQARQQLAAALHHGHLTATVGAAK